MFISLNKAKPSNTEIVEEVIVNITQICAIDKNFIFLSNGKEYLLTNESLKDLLLATSEKQKQVKNTEPKAELLELFEQLHKLTGGKGKTVFSLTREKKLAELLSKHRMTKELLIKAATNIGNDPFLQGDNESHKRYGDIDYLLRPDKAAKWSEDQKEKKKPGMF